MQKKIYISEEKLSSLTHGILLSNFLFKKLKEHKTSLGDNAAFPPSIDYPFDYMVIKRRYQDVYKAAESLELTQMDNSQIVSELSHKVKICMNKERPIRDALEKLCENVVNKLFAIPSEAIIFDLKLVDKITFRTKIRLRAESSDEAVYTFQDIDDIDMSSRAIEKRRFIDSLILGAAYNYASLTSLYEYDINKLDSELMPLYNEIRIINDYLLFNEKEKMSDDNPMQGAYVDTMLGGEGMKTTISAQGIIFPLLLQETIRGLFELFSSHGLPNDKEKAEYIVSKADFMLAEPWDMRLGVELWKMIFKNVDETNVVPYVFTRLVKLPVKKFNRAMREILAGTHKGEQVMTHIIDKSQYDNGYQQFNNRINARNMDKSLIQDSYFSSAETNGYDLDDKNPTDIVTERH